MGCTQSKQGLLTSTDGDGKDFLNKYNVDRILGQGEFGVVKLVYSKLNDQKMERPIACKMLKKGMQFKDNTIYKPINPNVLQSECGILKKLGGRHHTVKLIGVFESPSTIYILTEYLQGGDMFQYVSKYYGGAEAASESGSQTGGQINNAGVGLRTEDVSRMSFQLLDAINHCAKNGIIHRDIKPENIMFTKGERGSTLKLIDFGSGTFCATSIEGPTSSKGRQKTQYDLNHPVPPGYDEEEGTNEYEPTKIETATGDQLHLHTTFAGSAFYISPEMFRKHYTVMTDVWSVGVTLYVLVAGYPADALQEAFNKLHDNKERTIDSLKQLPNMPDNMPETFFEMLKSCLTYKHRIRKSASSILESSEFVRFHKEHAEEEDEDENKNDGNKRTRSIVIKGSVTRHMTMMKYGQFERSVTSLLAAMLVKAELKAVLDRIDHYIATHEQEVTEENLVLNRKRLQIIPIAVLCSILEELKHNIIITKITDLAHGEDYSKFAYHVAFLRQFYSVLQRDDKVDGDEVANAGGGSRDLDNSVHRKLKKAMSAHEAKQAIKNKSNHATEPNNSDYEEEREKHPSSIHNGNAWEIISKRLNKKELPRRPSF